MASTAPEDRPPVGVGRLRSRRAGQVADHPQPELAMRLEPVGERLGRRSGADDEHVAGVPAVLAGPR